MELHLQEELIWFRRYSVVFIFISYRNGSVLCHPLIYYVWNITTMLISFDKWWVELYKIGKFFSNLLNLKIKLRKNYWDSLMLIIPDLYSDFFFSPCFSHVCESFMGRLGRAIWLCGLNVRFKMKPKGSSYGVSIHVLKIKYCFPFLEWKVWLTLVDHKG